MIKSDINGISKWSKSIINVQCDSCGLEKEIKYKLYTSYGYECGEYLCRKCKLKKNNLDKWGVENVFQLEDVKEKSKRTNLEKRGVEYISQSDEVKNKIKKSLSKLDKDLINKKRIETVNKKWGVDNISQSDEIKNKKVEKYILNWGESHNKRSELFRIDNFKISNHPDYLKYLNDGISIFRCQKGHQFEINVDNFIRRTQYDTTLCTICNPIGKGQSGKEIQLFDFIKSKYGGDIVQNYKINRWELDIYLPDLNIGFEFNGVYWHSNKFKDVKSHLKKTEFFGDRGIRIIHIWEDDWSHKGDIIKSQISNLLNLNRRIWARKCIVKEISDRETVEEFLNRNHIQGWVNSNIKIGLYYEGDLVSLMTFDRFEGRKRMGDGEWNLNRFCNKLGFVIVGGASKILKFFIKKYEPKRIISYADRDWSIGNLYNKLGFIEIYKTKPDYKYLIGGRRFHKSNFKKSKTGVSESKLEIPKVWDCGKIKFEILI
jgi:hypothetical protein